MIFFQEYAETRGFEDSIKEFDVEFFKRKQIRTLFNIEEEAMREFFPLPHVLETIFILLKEHYNLVFTLVKPQVEIYFYRQGLKERLYALFSFLCKSISISLTRWFMGLLLNEKR